MLENKRLIKNEMKLLCTGLLLLLILNVTVGDMDPRYTALNFGNNHTNYILFKPDMEPLRNEFTLCSWIKSFLKYKGNMHVWISYALNESSGYYNEFVIGDAGRSYIFETKLSPSLHPYFTELRGNKTWFHYCTSWSFSTRTQKFYLNGNKIGETTTPEGRNLGVGGYLAIGSDQDSYGGGFDWGNRFGGELYKLNFFSKEVNASEIMEMSRSMCGGKEETYGELRHIKWKDIVELRGDRNGSVTDVATGCGKDPSKLWDLLHQIKKEKAVQETELQEKEQRLNTMGQELEQGKENSSRLSSELEQSKEHATQLTSQLEQSKENSSRLSSELEQSKEHATQLTSQLEQSKENSSRLSSELEQSKERATRLTTQLEQSKENSSRLSFELEQSKENSSRLSSELQQNGERATRLTTQLEQSKENSSRLSSELEQIKENSSRLSSELQQNEERATRLTSQLEQSKENSSRLSSELEQSKENSSRLSSELEHSKENAIMLNTELEDIKGNSSRLLDEHERISKAKDDQLQKMQKTVEKLGML